MSSINERKIRDVRDLWNVNKEIDQCDRENHPKVDADRHKHKYKTLERHLSMKKTIRKKMMRDLREIGDATEDNNSQNQPGGFLDQIKNDQPPPANIDKPSLWKRLTKGWGH
ncbi:uncharacterized protein LOC109609601 [Aethina tumida]|uniref:uncharacterized protein LOC109609601 n=1 Tax=Aethina tumida TaxID=116153 RepID=UPI00096B0074|nr:uncharacterized protein LOC109609601 [Aethina tumida]XP_019881854.1 uncharacterized protein LOC109609601 [Aethina tumida]XP_049824131.1 uncharacterized protein LOC109609601 [Aethina tumida]